MLYNFDFASALLGRFFYPHGISTNPTQVFIGKDDWLYLGEQYEKTVTSRRHQPTVQDAELARIIAGATTSWDQWLNLKGVSMFRVMLGPDKNTVYPEFLRTGRNRHPALPPIHYWQTTARGSMLTPGTR